MNENGGEVNDTFFHPAVIFPVNDKMRIYNEDQFGLWCPLYPTKY